MSNWQVPPAAPPPMAVGPTTGRTAATVMRTQGPFQGLDLSRDPRELGPMYAQVAHNVHCAHGAIERRPGVSLVADGELPAEPEVLYHHSSTEGDATKEWYAAAVLNGAHWEIYRLTFSGTGWAKIYTQVADMTGVRHLRPSFYRVSKDFVLITMPGEACFALKQNGDFFPLGISVDAAIGDLAVFVEHLQGESWAKSRWQLPVDYTDDIWAYYWVSFLYHCTSVSPQGICAESNAIGPLKVNVGNAHADPGWTLWVGLDLAGVLNHAPVGTTDIRLYRQMQVPTNDGRADGVVEPYAPTRRQTLVFMTLPTAFPWESGEPYDVAWPLTRYDIPLGYIQGGFSYMWDGASQVDLLAEQVAPTRNAPPPCGVMLAALHQNKMFYARVPEISSVAETLKKGEDTLWYSAEQEYWHVAEDNVMKVGEDGKPITGLATYFGQLLIFKENEVWALRGGLDTLTNLSAALGEPAPWGTHELSPVARGVGCVAVQGGPAVLEAGNLLYFVGPGGLYVYNGQVILEVSQAIAPALRGIRVDVLANSQLAYDPSNKLIYWLVGELGQPTAGQGARHWLDMFATYPPVIWVYHYADATDQGGGRWTHWGGLGSSEPTCIATRQAAVLTATPDPQLVVGLANRRVCQTTPTNVDNVGPEGDTSIAWYWMGGNLHGGAPERLMRWHYLTIQFEHQDQDSAFCSVFKNNEGPTAAIDAINFAFANTDCSFKRRIGLRSRTVTPLIFGFSQQAPVQIVGFQIDATLLESR